MRDSSFPLHHAVYVDQCRVESQFEFASPLFLGAALCGGGSHGIDRSGNIFQRPQAINDASGHRRRHAQRMDAGKAVEHEIERQRVNVIVQLFWEAVGQAREPAHGHAHGEVLALDTAGLDMGNVGIAFQVKCSL